MTQDVDTSWFDDAACRGTAIRRGDHSEFFGTSSGSYHKALLAGKARCAVCPVAHECLRYSEELEITHGTYGGLDQEERRRFLNEHRSVTTPRGRAAHQQALIRLRETVPNLRSLNGSH